MKLKAYAVEWVENVKDMDVLIAEGWYPLGFVAVVSADVVVQSSGGKKEKKD